MKGICLSLSHLGITVGCDDYLHLVFPLSDINLGVALGLLQNTAGFTEVKLLKTLRIMRALAYGAFGPRASTLR